MIADILYIKVRFLVCPAKIKSTNKQIPLKQKDALNK